MQSVWTKYSLDQIGVNLLTRLKQRLIGCDIECVLKVERRTSLVHTIKQRESHPHEGNGLLDRLRLLGHARI